MAKIHPNDEEEQDYVPLPEIEIFKQDITIYCDLFVQANLELNIVKQSSDILDVDKLKLIFGEVNIKKEGLIAKVFEMSREEFEEIEIYLADRFSELNGIEKRALAELKAGILNAKAENFIF
ncbi:MAG: hypothetical protein PHS92_01325 [Candidatus Gracilibacteria bacterium]|nr:hypothetical protein [Candidatus Gracilibacteria bacterium]